MENRVINASLSTPSLTFRPGGSEASFQVTVINGSDQFAAFQLEVLAVGASRSSGSLWYRLEPEVAAAKPPGGITEFIIVIFDTPMPAFVGTINLTVRIFSPQLREERKLLVRLTIEPGAKPTLLSVELPERRLQVYPRNTVDIPVRVRNLGQQPVDVVLSFKGLDQSWLDGSAERRLWVDPGTQAEITFQCRPPSANQAPSQDYPFKIEASSRDGSHGRTEGILEVLPVGYIEFTATPQQQTIPIKGGWVPDWKSDSASFQLLFKNKSNLRQQVKVELQSRDIGKCTCRVIPEDADVGLGETTKVLLEVRKKRPWLGLRQTLRLEAKALLSDQRLGSTDPATQILELQVLPKVPLWLLLLLALLALLAALLAFLNRPAITHTDFVNSVRFSGDAFSVVSGSDDCTLRLWEINGDRLEPKGTAAKSPDPVCGRKPPNPAGLLKVVGKPVRALEFMPEESDRVAAGLENGVIELWNVRTREQEGELKDKKDNTSDRVFDLVFTKDSRRLFSSHGSGKVRVWVRESPNSEFKPDPQEVIDLGIRLKYPIQALALSQDERTLVTAGNFKRVILLAPTDPKTSPRRLSAPELNGGDGDFIWSLAFAPKYPKLLATSDSDGYITIWDLDKCQGINSTRQQDEPIEQKCEQHDRWLAAEKSAPEKSVRSIAFDLDGRQLVSAGDDGRLVVWPLTSDLKLDRQKAANGWKIDKSPKKLNSIALTKDNQGIMIVSGGDDFQVKLHRLK